MRQFTRMYQSKVMNFMICDSCGYKNDDNAKNCKGCGTALKPGMSDEELSCMLNRLSDRSDALTASPLDKMIRLAFFSLSLINLLVCFIFSAQPLINIIAIIITIFGGVVAGYPKVIWEINKLRLSVYANADEITPTDFWSLSRKISYWILFFFTIALTVISLLINRVPQ